MADHDPLCPAHPARPWAQTDCRCGLIARVVDQERKAMSDRLLTLYLQLGDMLNDYNHAEAVAAKLVEVICENAESEAWLEDSNQQLRGQITQSIQNGYKLRRERDAALAEVAALRDEIARVMADLRAKVEAGWVPELDHEARIAVLALFDGAQP